MKIIHLYSGNRFGGVERVLLQLFIVRKHLSEIDQEYIIIFDGLLSQKLIEEGAKVNLLFPVKFSKPWTIIRAWTRINSLLNRRRPQVLICHDIWSFVIGHLPARIYGCKIVLWAHTEGLHYYLYKYLDFFKPDLIISCSDFLKKQLQVRFKNFKVTTIYAPFNFSHSHLSTANKIQQKFNVLFAGRLVPLKGADLLIKAIALIADQDVHLTILGIVTNPQESDFLEEINKLIYELKLNDRVSLLINQTNVKSFYQSADLYCQPNRNPETFGLTFVEALSFGLPVVTSKLGGAIEILMDQNQTFGSFINPDDIESIKVAILEWKNASDKRIAFAEKARTRVLELCSSEVVLKKLEQELRLVCGDQA